MGDQDKALSDATLLRLFNDQSADLSVLTPDERKRLLALTEPKKDEPKKEEPKPATPAPQPVGPRQPAAGRGTQLDVQASNKWAKDNAPAIGAMLATTATGGTAAVPLATAAFGGGLTGSVLRGDDPLTGAWEGGKQALWQAGPRMIQGLARIPYGQAIPKAIKDEFRTVDLSRFGLDNRIWLGTHGAVDAAARAGQRAEQARQAAAPTVAGFTEQHLQDAMQPAIEKATLARRPDKLQEVYDYIANRIQQMRQAGTQVNQGQLTATPMVSAEQRAAKSFLEQEGKSAMRANNAAMAAADPQLANAERAGIRALEQQSPQMAQAMNDAQAAVGLGRAAEAQENSGFISRLVGEGNRGSGVWNALRTPLGTSGVGIAINELGRNLGRINPQMTRALLSLLGGEEDEEQ